MNNDCKLAVVIELSGLIKQAVETSLNNLEHRLQIKYIKEMSYAPHITLVSDLSGDPVLLADAIRKRLACNPVNSFTLEANGLGIFVRDTPVVHIRWIKNSALCSLFTQVQSSCDEMMREYRLEGFVENLDWVAKTTLAFKDCDYVQLPQIIAILNENSFEGQLSVTSLAIYEYSHSKPENKLANIYL